jgi:hypothetical protein
MASSPKRRLYRKSRVPCQGASNSGMRYRQICIAFMVCMFAWSAASGQIAKRRTISKGPRAVGLIQVDAKGSGHLVPITIMVDGHFYDASVYKADPVPMALQPGTVYEGLKSGVSQGLFTVNNPIPHNGWLGLGIWKSHEQIEAEKQKAKAHSAMLAQKPADDVTAGGPPRLSRTPEGAHPKAPEPAKTADAAGDEDRPKLKKKTVDPSTADSQPSASLAAAESGRPVLRRQAEGEAPQEQTKIQPKELEPLKGTLQEIPAISDADGPQPRPYTYETKPEEMQNFMQKMSAMAADDVNRRVEMLSGSPEGKTKAGRAKLAPEFHDAELKVLDISGNNEAVLIYTATAKSPGRPDLQFRTTVVARQDIYADLHKIFSHTTDNNHLDMQPRYEFIDAVDADGDGRGDLLFKQVWDSGSGFAIYRVIGDRLWPLFESKPGS